MNLSLLQALRSGPSSAVRLSLHRPTLVILLWILAALLSVAGISRLSIETTVDSTLYRSHPAWQFFEKSQELFGGDEVIVVLLKADEPFGRATLEEMYSLTRRLQGTSGVRRVDSLSSMPMVKAETDGSLDLRPAYRPGLSPAEVAKQVEGDRVAPNYLVSDDGRWMAVNLVLEKEGEKDIDQILHAVEDATRGLNVHVSGVPVTRAATNRRLQDELVRFVPVTVVVIGALLFFFFRSFVAVMIPLVVNGIGTLVLLGIMGATGGTLTISTAFLPTLLLALGAAYSMHLLHAAAGESAGRARHQKMTAAANPIFLSGITTAVGFGALAFVPIPVIRQVGGYGALGVLVILAACLTACPAMLSFWPIRRKTPKAMRYLTGPVSRQIASLCAARPRAIILSFGLVAVVAAAGIPRLNVESDVVLWFQRADPVRVDYERIREALSGISPMNVVVESRRAERISEPRYVAALAKLGNYLEKLPEVGKTISIADPLLQMHWGFNAERGVPRSREAIEQYLLLLDGVEHTRDLITSDRTRANMVLRMDDNGSADLLETARLAERWWESHGPEGSVARVTGIMHEFARAEHAITVGQLRGLFFATLVVSAILWLTYGSLSLALMGLLPNIVPVAVGFGGMGWLGIPLDAGTALLGTLVLGIAVDDTVHVIAGFRRRRAARQTSGEAVQGMFADVLPPVLATTCAVGGGFLVLALSGFLPIRNLGFLIAGILIVCLAADLFLLPAFLARSKLGARKGW